MTKPVVELTLAHYYPTLLPTMTTPMGEICKLRVINAIVGHNGALLPSRFLASRGPTLGPDSKPFGAPPSGHLVVSGWDVARI